MTSSTPNEEFSPLFVSKEEQDQTLTALKLLGVSKIVCEYSGSGDSGQIDEVFVLNNTGAHIDVDKVPLIYEGVDMSGGELIEKLTWNAIDMGGHSGFYNNEGGYGTLEITFDPICIQLHHANYVTTQEDYEHDFTTGVS